MPEQGFDIDAARKAGYSDDDILSHLTETRKFDVDGATKAGYSKADIISHLAGAPAAAPTTVPGNTPAERQQYLRSHPDAAAANRAATSAPFEHKEPEGSATSRFLNGLVSPITGPAREVWQFVTDHDAWVKQHAGTGGAMGDALSIPGAPQAGQAATGDLAGAVASTAGQAALTAAQIKAAGPKVLDQPGATARDAAIVPRVPKIKSTLNPVEQGAVDFLREKDVPLTPGTITGNKFVRALESTTQNTPLGSTTAADFTRGTEAGIRRVAGNLADEAYPKPVTPESAGSAIPARLKKNISNMGLERDEAYQDAWQGRGESQHTYDVPVRMRKTPELDAEGKDTGKLTEKPVMAKVNMPVDVRDIKAQAEPIFEEMQWMPAADRASNAGYAAVEKILKGDDFIPAWQAETGLGGLKTMARLANKSGVRDSAQGIAASIIPDLQAGIDAAVAKTGEAAIRGLQKGRQVHANMMEVADLAEKLREEPVQTFNQLTWQNDTGVKFLRQIQDQAPEQMPQIGRAFVQQMIDKAGREGGFTKTRSLLDRWNDLGPETKKILFPEAELRDNLGKFFKGADMVAQNPNPSGTALVQAANSVNPVRWAAGYLGSKLFFTPRGIALLTEGMNPRSPGAAAMNAARVKALAGRNFKSTAAVAGAEAAGQSSVTEK